MARADVAWPEADIFTLRRLWDQADPELSSAEIGRRMARSKNSIVGKAHRLELPPRPSPIIRDGAKLPRETRDYHRTLRQRQVTLSSLPSLHGTVAPVVPAYAQPIIVVPRPVVVKLAPPPPAFRYGRVKQCCWPTGEPGTPQFRFCQDPSEPGKPYCPDHCQLAYNRVRDHREDGAALSEAAD